MPKTIKAGFSSCTICFTSEILFPYGLCVWLYGYFGGADSIASNENHG